jgi:hypothetical protein
MLSVYGFRDDYRSRRDHYRGRPNHDDRRSRGGGDGLTVMTLRALFDAVALSACNYYASEEYCYAKGQGGGFQTVVHDHNSFSRFGSA